jgi:hypothetical protein
MDHRIVGMLGRKIEDAIRGVVGRHLKPPRLPLLLSRHTIHLMAKAPVSVYEVADNTIAYSVYQRATSSHR